MGSSGGNWVPREQFNTKRVEDGLLKSTKNHKIRNFRCPVPSHFGQSGTLHFDGWGLAFVVGLAFPPLSSLYGVYWCLPLQQSRTNCPHEPHFQHGGYGGGIGCVCCCGGTCIWALRRFSSPPGRVWASTVASVPTPLAPLHVPLGPSLLSHPRASVHTFFLFVSPSPFGRWCFHSHCNSPQIGNTNIQITNYIQNITNYYYCKLSQILQIVQTYKIHIGNANSFFL